MATHTQVQVVSDLSGEPGTETVLFKVGGVSYVVDLTEAEASEMRALLHPYMRAGRQIRTPGRPVRARQGRSQSAPAVRAWFAEQGRFLPSRGRLPQAAIDEYERANA